MMPESEDAKERESERVEKEKQMKSTFLRENFSGRTSERWKKHFLFFALFSRLSEIISSSRKRGKSAENLF
jgi:sarcosine oxidase delta subunit